ncbi:hypothetical protein FHX82_004805 [Amycolatopsis bartoniae]|uniref:Uncharacterized protein n=1 Tax=Amycolatopsis bartoniae TaxID=941986 RepID=A0A8H9M3N8_9PSEU|nr:hypothetical protein [Amycolatopsis bartoniae]MBB2937729.1 hypothetical protein [Amycolatopsis bartoniae]GHF40261.1 hypothetical protein GCM10017566_12050 [Amycolatopsis bartoniae]
MSEDAPDTWSAAVTATAEHIRSVVSVLRELDLDATTPVFPPEDADA